MTYKISLSFAPIYFSKYFCICSETLNNLTIFKHIFSYLVQSILIILEMFYKVAMNPT